MQILSIKISFLEIIGLLLLRIRFKLFLPSIQESGFLSTLKYAQARSKYIDGITKKHGFSFVYSSAFLQVFPTKIPLTDIEGETANNDSGTQLIIKVRSGILPSVFLICIILLALVFVVSELFGMQIIRDIPEREILLHIMLLAVVTFYLPLIHEIISARKYIKLFVQRIDKEMEDQQK